MEVLLAILVTTIWGFIVYKFGHKTWDMWMKFVNGEFLANYSWITLEVKIPKDVYKSPVAMEAVLEAFQQGGGMGTWFDKYWKGNMLNWFSLEIASIGGEIHFFIKTKKNFRNIIESYIYAQYPKAEVVEVPDYANMVYFDPETMNLMGTKYVLTGKDYLPIKTYIDYGLDRDPKEEYKIDPLTPMLEFMGSAKKSEQVWFQILIRVAKGPWKKDGQAFIDWKLKRTIDPEKKKELEALGAAGEEELAKLKAKLDEEKKSFNMSNLSRADKDMIDAIERSLAKNGFECMIRAIYLADKKDFDGTKIPGIMGIMKPFSAVGEGVGPSFNGFKPEDNTSFDLPWQDTKAGTKLAKLKKKMFEQYVRQEYFYLDVFDSFSLSYEVNSFVDTFLRYGFNPAPSKRGSFVLTTEELATLYHFPGSVAGTPAFKRIASAKSEAPSNLPI